ncbi:glycosyltransferase family 2 protein [Chloroflexota bacterium]
MSDDPKISVIMSVYNSEKYLGEAIDHILDQTFPDFDFIIVNDSSTDNSLEIIQSYIDERIRIINNKRNMGLTKSLNKAIKQARGEYIARQDADDISLPNRFEEQIRYLEKHPQVALLGTSVHRIDEYGEIFGKIKVLEKPVVKLFKGNQFNHGSVMFRKKVINELEAGYNELFRYCQDYELWLRIAKYYEIRNLTQVLYKLRLHQENVSFLRAKESALYHLLALRVAGDNLTEEMLRSIKDDGIMSLYSYLSRNEKIHFYKSIANVCMNNNALTAARLNYKEVFKLAPFDLKNVISVILSYLGKGVWTKACKTYGIFRHS